MKMTESIHLSKVTVALSSAKRCWCSMRTVNEQCERIITTSICRVWDHT